MKLLSKILIYLPILFLLVSCDDYFDSSTDDTIDSDEYINSEDEMYTGFLGIITKMQDVADQSVYLTDTRGDFLQPTTNAPQELWDIYNYSDLQDNSFADPSGYYDLIIACNDYFDKMFAYQDESGDDMDETAAEHFDELISSAIRVKVWTYLKLGSIYGEAVYFDDPVTDLSDLADSASFTKLSSMDDIVSTCYDLLINGMNGIDGSLTMDWGEWLDEEDPDNSDYDAWDYVVPDYLCMRCEMELWNGNYSYVREQILELLYETFSEETAKYRLNAYWTSNVYRIFAQGTYYSRESISSVIYDYDNNQTNNLIHYFGNRYPCEFLLKPTTYAMSQYGDDDTRADCYFMSQDDDTVCTKYHYSYNYRTSYESDASVPLYRAHDLHFMLAEAENHLGNWGPAGALLNEGIGGHFTTLTVDTTEAGGWDSRYQSFIDNSSYPNIGIVGCVSGDQYDLPDPTDDDYDLTEDERIETYDMALLDEMLKEYAAEGRSYGMMLRMAHRYDDYSIISDRVCPKYDESLRESVRSTILNGGYYVSYDLGF